MENKRCPTCEATKPVASFAKHGRSRDGLNWQCRECHSVRMKRMRTECTAKNSMVDVRPSEKRCPDCSQVKSGSDFASNVAQSDGLNVVCRICDKKRQEARRRKYRATPLDRAPASKVCGHCGNEKPSSGFRKNGSRKDGLSAVCTECADASIDVTVKRYREKNLNKDPYSEKPEKKCPVCADQKPSTEFSKDRSTPDGLAYMCRTCALARSKEWQAKNKPRTIWLAAKARANQIGLDFSIEVSDVVIPESCPVLGTKFIKSVRSQTASLDRIVPSKGYVPGNVVVVSMRANRLKSDATLEELRKLVAFYEQLLI